MWLLAFLFGLLLLVAAIEQAWYVLVRRPIDQAVQASYARQVDQEIQALVMLDRVINLAEQLYTTSSDYGCPYPKHTRFALAQALAAARQTITDRVGPSPFIDRSHITGSTWPYNAEGQVKP